MGNQKQGQGKKKGCKASGRNDAKSVRYMNSDAPVVKALARILRSSGAKAGADWAKSNGAVRILDGLTHGIKVQGVTFGGPETNLGHLADEAFRLAK